MARVLVAARRRKERIYPELVGHRARARLVVLAGEVGGRWSHEVSTFVRLLARAEARSEPSILRRRLNNGGSGGAPSWLVRQVAPSSLPCWT